VCRGAILLREDRAGAIQDCEDCGIAQQRRPQLDDGLNSIYDCDLPGYPKLITTWWELTWVGNITEAQG